MSRINSAEIPGRPTDPERIFNDTVPQWQTLSGKPFAGKYPEIPAVCNIDCSSPVLLTLPKSIYAVSGSETRIYFNNLVQAENKEDLVFEVVSAVGKCCEKFYSFTAETPGAYPCKITVKNNGKIAGCAETLIRVAPQNAGNEQNAVILTVGDSILADGEIVRFYHQLCQKYGNKNIRLMGSHAGSGKPLSAGEIAVEAYGGWKWNCFMSRYGSENNYNSKSKFIRIVNGKTDFILQEYLDKYNDTSAPDVVIFSLGCNDIALADKNSLSGMIAGSFAARKKLIQEFRKVMPDTIIGVVLLMPPNISDTAFEENYHGEITRKQYTINQFNYMRQTLLELQNDHDISLIPVYTAIDEKMAYPENNALHPNDFGKQQFAETLFAWFKNILYCI